MSVRRARLALVALLLTGCGGPPSVETRINESLDQMESHGEAGERGAFMAYLAEDFSGQHGAFDRETFGQYLVLQWSQYRRLYVQRLPAKIVATGPESASASFRTLVTGGQGLLPERGQLFDVETQWALEDGDWLLVRANWEPVLDAAP